MIPSHRTNRATYDINGVREISQSLAVLPAASAFDDISSPAAMTAFHVLVSASIMRHFRRRAE